MNKKDLPAMYSTVFWCLFVVLLVFWLYCLTTFTPFKERSGYAIKPKKPVKRQTDTKTQWNTLQVSLSYSFHLRKSKV